MKNVRLSTIVRPLCFALGLLALSACSTPHPSATAIAIDELPVLPGLTGFGITTPAGRGGEILRVTNLNADGPGSLRAAIEAPGPRVIVFEVSGTIRLTKNLYVREPFVTIAGQTAPSPGITIRGAGLFILTHDVLVQHLRIRPGGALEGPRMGNRDAVAIGSPDAQSTYNVVVDHVSCSWATDETISTWGAEGSGGISDVTLHYCLVSEGLATPLNPGGLHSMGVLIGRESRRVALIGTVMAYNHFRHPLIRDNVTDVVVLNNLIHMSRQWTKDKIAIGTRGDADWPLRVSIVGNTYNPVPNAHNANFISIDDETATDTRVFLADNLAPNSTADAWDPAVVSTGKRDVTSLRADTPPIWHESLKPMPAHAVEERLTRFAGARPADRDPVDERIFRMIRKRTVQLEVAAVADVGGYPELAENHRPLVLPDNPHADDNGDGYTNLEEWLHAHAAAVEGH